MCLRCPSVYRARDRSPGTPRRTMLRRLPVPMFHVKHFARINMTATPIDPAEMTDGQIADAITSEVLGWENRGLITWTYMSAERVNVAETKIRDMGLDLQYAKVLCEAKINSVFHREYSVLLRDVFGLITATPRERCEAMLRTVREKR